jgi:cytidine deaminase
MKNIAHTTIEALFLEAQQAAFFAYAPYSKFRVGAALLAEDGTIYTGCNVENRSFGLTICAERSALVQGVSKGKRSFTALAIATPDAAEPVGPCGACRQVLTEFMKPEAPVCFGCGDSKQITLTIGELLPFDSLHDLAAMF